MQMMKLWTAALLESGWDWIDGRQTSFYLIR